MLREYEFTFITRVEGAEGESQFLSGYEDILTREGGAVLRKDEWGTKRLAYPIRKNFKGRYVHYKLATLPKNIAESERLLRIDDNVLRHLVVKVNDRVDVEARTAELAKSEQTVQKQER